MSGMRGYARPNKLKVKATIVFADTGKRVRSNLFVGLDVTPMDIVDRLATKYGKDLYVEQVKAHGHWEPLFQKMAA